MQPLKSVMPLALLLALNNVAMAGPGLITYQGRLTDSAGQPIPTPVEVTFTFWDAPTGGTPLGGGFSDTDSVTPDIHGTWSTLIGDDPDNLIPATVFEGDSVWLNLRVNGENLAPRQRITSVGFAMRSQHAGDANTLAGRLPESFAPAGHAHSASDIASGMLPDARIEDALTISALGSVDAAAIQSGMLAAERIPAVIARDSEILPAVLAGDGPGSTLYADTVDGKHASQLTPPTSVGGLSGGTITSDVTVQGKLTATTIVQAGPSPSAGFTIGAGDVVAADDLLAANNLGLAGGGNDGSIFIKKSDGTLDAVTISGANRSFQINPPKTRYLSLGRYIIPLVDYDTRELRDCWVNDSQYLYAHDTDKAYGFFGVHLPQGAIVTALDVWGQTAESSHEFRCYLHRKALTSSAIYQTMAEVTSSNTDMTLSDTSIASSEIDNGSFEYYVFMDRTTFFRLAKP